MPLTKYERFAIESPIMAQTRKFEVSALSNGIDLTDARILNIGAGKTNLPIKSIRQNTASVLNTDIESFSNLDLVADAQNLPFSDNEFDATIFLRVLHHIGDYRFALDEALRCTKPGGHMLVSEPCRLAVELQKLTGLDSHPENVISRKDVEQFATDNNLGMNKLGRLFWYYYGYQLKKPE